MCNIIVGVKRIFKCCVLFLVYYNEFVVLCRNGVCGYFVNLLLIYGDVVFICDVNVVVMLLFYGVFIEVFVNWIKKIMVWVVLNYKVVLDLLLCIDYCGVNINWYIVFDFIKGWSVCLILLDWFNIIYLDWYVVIEMFMVMLGL